MPTVRRYQRQVQPSAMPGARRTAALTPEAAGVQVARAKGELAATTFSGDAQVAAGWADFAGSLGRTTAMYATRMQEKAKRDADAAAHLDAQVRVETGVNAYTSDPKEGVFYTRTGRQANTLLSEAMPKYDQIVADATKDLSPEQKKEFAGWLASHRLRFNANVQGFVGKESEKWMDSTAEAAIDIHLQQAARNVISPKLFYSELSQAVSIIEQTGKRKGLDVRAQVVKAQTEAHTNAIETLLDAGMVSTATKWLDEADTGRQMDPQAALKLRDMIKKSGTAKQGQEMADKALAEGKTLGEQMDLVKLWTKDDADPTGAIRQHAEERLKGMHTVKEQAKLDYERETLRVGYDYINKDPGQSYLAIPKKIRDDPNNAELLIHWKNTSKQMRENAQPDRYGAEYLSLSRLAVTHPDTFKDANLETVRYLMTREEYGQLHDLQNEVIKGNAEAAAKKLPTIAQFDDTVTTELMGYGYKKEDIDGSDKALAWRKNEVLQIKRAVAIAIETRQSASQDPVTKQWRAAQRVTEQDVRDMVAKAKVDQVNASKPGWWPWAEPEIVKKPAIQMTIADVPRKARQEIEAQLREMTTTPGPFPDALILSRYLNEYSGARR